MRRRPGVAGSFETFVARPAYEPAWQALRRASSQDTGLNAAQPERRPGLARMLRDTSSLRARYLGRQIACQDTLVPQAAAGCGPPAKRAAPPALAAAGPGAPAGSNHGGAKTACTVEVRRPSRKPILAVPSRFTTRSLMICRSIRTGSVPGWHAAATSGSEKQTSASTGPDRRKLPEAGGSSYRGSREPRGTSAGPGTLSELDYLGVSDRGILQQPPRKYSAFGVPWLRITMLSRRSAWTSGLL